MQMQRLDPRDCVAEVLDRTSGGRIVPGSLTFLKEGGNDHVRVLAATYTLTDGAAKRALVSCERLDDSAWVVTRLGAGSVPSGPLEPGRVDLSGGGFPHRFSGGGWIVGTHPEPIAAVRLTFANGVVVEDEAAGNIVLFVAAADAIPPAVVETLASDGSVIDRRTAFDSALLLELGQPA